MTRKAAQCCCLVKHTPPTFTWPCGGERDAEACIAAGDDAMLSLARSCLPLASPPGFACWLRMQVWLGGRRDVVLALGLAIPPGPLGHGSRVWGRRSWVTIPPTPPQADSAPVPTPPFSVPSYLAPLFPCN
jgi:hypothetical protein